jgi:hypothetical protein
VARLRTYLTNKDDVVNVLQYHQQTLVNLIHSQMQQHFVESAEAYEAHPCEAVSASVLAVVGKESNNSLSRLELCFKGDNE